MIFSTGLTVSDLRNSAQHFEDRNRQLAYDRKIEPKPFIYDNSNVSVTNTFVISTLLNDSLSNTSQDGSLNKLEISEKSLGRALDSFELFLNALSWTGPERVHPE